MSKKKFSCAYQVIKYFVRIQVLKQLYGTSRGMWKKIKFSWDKKAENGVSVHFVCPV